MTRGNETASAKTALRIFQEIATPRPERGARKCGLVSPSPLPSPIKGEEKKMDCHAMAMTERRRGAAWIRKGN